MRGNVNRNVYNDRKNVSATKKVSVASETVIDACDEVWLFTQHNITRSPTAKQEHLQAKDTHTHTIRHPTR